MSKYFAQIRVCIGVFWYRFQEAVFVSKNQYRLKLIQCYEASNSQLIAVIQVVIKRVKTKFSVRYLACNPRILNDIHPVDVCKIAFIANIENEMKMDQIPDYIKTISPHHSIIKQAPSLKIASQSFNNNETIFTIEDLHSNYKQTFTAYELAQNANLLYGLGSQESARVGISASNDYLKKLSISTTSTNPHQIQNHFHFYHILCISYVTLILSGLSIVRRMFPFHIPFTDFVIPFGGGIIFFPITFCIQDITTEVYGFNAARHMVFLSILSILFVTIHHNQPLRGRPW